MPTNIRQFEMTMERYEHQVVPQLIQDRMTLISIQAAMWLVEKTPRDTGLAKGNWQMTLGNPAEGQIERYDEAPVGSSAGSPTIAETTNKMGRWKPQFVVWFHNGVPYIGILNDGAENRVAHHMLERTVSELKRWLGAQGLLA